MLFLLKEIEVDSPLFYHMLKSADTMSRRYFKGYGEVHGQVGINRDKCSMNCQFCDFAEVNFGNKEGTQLSDEIILKRVYDLLDAGVGSISLMSTADLPFEEYQRIGQMIMDATDGRAILFGNWGDLDYGQAKALKEIGFRFYYHALRLREGIDTGIMRYKRIETMKNIHAVGLLLGSCLEPIGPEHTYEEIVDLLVEMKALNVVYMATMKRIATPNSRFKDLGEISDMEFAKITAVTRLFFGRQLLTMAAHEPSALCLKSGANFLVAEVGTNPRDNKLETEENRGLSAGRCEEMLSLAGYKVFKGDFLQRYEQLRKDA